jgi:hypothetical protein
MDTLDADLVSLTQESNGQAMKSYSRRRMVITAPLEGSI